MQVDIFDTTGKSVGKLALDKKVFGAEPNEALVSQYVRVYLANQRQGTSKVKGRAEVSGGGRKPWRQKGTGRARHGSIRSPLWPGGGIVHGPEPRDHSLSLPKKMKAKAMISALSHMAAGGGVNVIEGVDTKKVSKSKELAEVIKSLGLRGKVLLVLPEKNDLIVRSGRNIKNLSVSLGTNLSVYDVLSADHVLFLKKALEEIQERYKGK